MDSPVYIHYALIVRKCISYRKIIDAGAEVVDSLFLFSSIYSLYNS